MQETSTSRLKSATKQSPLLIKSTENIMIIS